MDPIEKALRSALERGDSGEPSFRAKVYASAEAALERSLASRNTPQDEAAARRRKLAALVGRIEVEHQAASDAAMNGHSPVATPTRPSARSSSQVRREDEFPAAPSRAPEVAVTGTERGQRAAADTAAGERGGTSVWTLVRQVAANRWLRIGARILVLLLLVFAAWWIWVQATALYSDLSRSAADGGERPRLTEKAPVGDGQSADSRWTTVFSPRDAAGLTVPPGANAQLVQVDGGEGVALSGANPDDPFRIEIGEGVLASLTGKKVLFDIVARSASNGPVEATVRCDFGPLGTCDRKRLTVQETDDHLFSVDLAAVEPRGAGALLIVPDVGGDGMGIIIESIRVTVAASD